MIRREVPSVFRLGIVGAATLLLALVGGAACVPGGNAVVSDGFSPVAAPQASARVSVDMFARGSFEPSGDRRKPYRVQLPLLLTETGGLGGTIQQVEVSLTFTDPREVLSLVVDAESIRSQGGALRFEARTQTQLIVRADFAMMAPPSAARFLGGEVRVHYAGDGGEPTWSGRLFDVNHTATPGWPFEFNLGR